MNIPDILKDGVETSSLLVLGEIYAKDKLICQVKPEVDRDLFYNIDDMEATVQFIADAINEKIERSKNND